MHLTKVFALLAVLASPELAVAQEGKGLVGLGVMVGEPTGISAKYYLADDKAIDGAVGVAPFRGGLHAHSNYLWHLYILKNQDDFVLLFYAGVGGRLLDKSGNRDEEGIFHMGFRGTAGGVFDFKKLPIDAFIEVAPILDFRFSSDEDQEGLALALNIAVGARYYF